MHIKTLRDFYSVEGAGRLVALFNAWAQKDLVRQSGLLRADHVCYKCSTREEYERIRNLFEFGRCRFLYQSVVSSRHIAYIKMRDPIETIAGPIEYLELSDQKLDLSQVSGFEHIEIYPTDPNEYSSLIKAFIDAGMKFELSDRPHHPTYDLDIGDGFEVRFEAEPLVETIKREM